MSGYASLGVVYYPAEDGDSSFVIEWFFNDSNRIDPPQPFLEKYRNVIFERSYGGLSCISNFKSANIKLEDFLEEARDCSAFIAEDYDDKGAIRFDFPTPCRIAVNLDLHSKPVKRKGQYENI